jgi:hypothetical protein
VDLVRLAELNLGINPGDDGGVEGRRHDWVMSGVNSESVSAVKTRPLQSEIIKSGNHIEAGMIGYRSGR